MPHQYPTVKAPSTVFHPVGTPVQVPTTGAIMLAHIKAWNDPSVPLGLFNERVPETEVVRQGILNYSPVTTMPLSSFIAAD